MKTVKCGKCGWYHFERSRADVVLEAENFLAYISRQPDETRGQFGYGPLGRRGTEFKVEDNVLSSEKCFNCGASYKDFVEDDGKCPLGVTIQGIIRKEE